MNRRVLFVYPNLQLMQIVPPGILSLASFIKSKGHTVELFDTTFYQLTPRSCDEERIDYCQVRPFRFEDSGIEYVGNNKIMIRDFLTKISVFKPDILAVSVNDFTQRIARDLIKDIKQLFPNLFIVLGGVFPTFFPDYSINIDDVDAICIGEGWGALLDICEKYGTSEIVDIKNLWVNYGGQVYKNDVRKPIALSELPPDDYTLFNEKRYFRPMQGKMLRMCPIWTDVGCPYQCTYCTAPGLCALYKDYKYIRLKEIDQIINDIDNAITLINPSYLYFSAETFFARPERELEEFARIYKEKYNLPFWCETHIHTINRKNILLLKQMNCDRVSVGLESGNESYRIKMLKKTFTNSMFLRKMKLLSELGLNVTINNIIGLPDETREMIFDTIRVNQEVQQQCTNIDVTMAISTYVPCGGQPLRNYALGKGYFNNEEYLNMPIGQGFHRGVFLTMPQISPEQVRGLLRTFPLYVKMPKEYFPQIERAERFDVEGNREFDVLKTIYWDKYFKPFKIQS